jgi:RNA polymerase sigma factor (sigma-70 family)
LDAAERRRRWQLVLPHRTYLVRIAVSRGMSRDDAEDCAQEAMVRCVGFAALDEARVVEFLATTTMRLAMDRHRTHARDARVSAKLTPWYVAEPSPEEATCDRGEASWVAAHVAALPESQRTALTAKAEGLSCQEIAARMGLSYKAVESLLSRARAYVRAAVATAWVLVARLNRRAVDVPQAVPAMALVALVTAGALAPGGPAAPAPAALPRVTAPAARTAVAPRAAARPAAPREAVAPRAVRRVPAGAAAAVAAPPAPRPSSPLPVPVPNTCTTAPLVDTCVRLDGYRPGSGVKQCLENGVTVTARHIGCGHPDS